jgi:diguanylate cyclase (GGDEF)-like protein/PAS domain S-box-containing protein
MLNDSLNTGLLLDKLPIGITVLNPNLEIEYANPLALKILGLKEHQTIGKLVSDPQWLLVDRFHEPLPLEKYPAVQVLHNKSAIDNFEFGIYNPEKNDYTWLLSNAYPDLNKHGEVTQIIVTFTNVSDQKEAIPFEQIVHNANDIVVVTKAEKLRNGGPEIIYVNKAFSTLTKYSEEEALGNTPRMLQGPKTCSKMREKIYQHLCKGEQVLDEIYNYDKYGNEYWMELNIVSLKNSYGKITHFAAIQRDITEQKDHEHNLTEMAMTDPLTGLANRRAFYSKAKFVLNEVIKQKSSLCLAVVDIDYFKKVNDTYGHDIGDEVLVKIAKLMNNNTRDTDVLGRIGGEEFALILKDVTKENGIKRLEIIRRSIESISIILSTGESLSLSVSIGCTDIIPESKNIDKMVKQADIALYRAKEEGRNCTVYYS